MKSSHLDALRLPKAALRSVYDLCIKARSTDGDQRRREHIFNVIIVTVLCAAVILETSTIYAQMRNPSQSDIHLSVFSFFIAVFATLLALSRKGGTRLASYLFIGIHFLGTAYGAYVWGIEFPLPLLSFATIIVMSSILLGSRQGFSMAALISLTVFVLGYLQSLGIIQSDTSWKQESVVVHNAIGYAVAFLVIVTLSWLSNRYLEHSLERARESERELKKERDSLEERIEERTKELKAAQLEKVSQLYRFVEFGKLSSGIFHDLLNPLTAVSLTVEKLQRSSQSKEHKETIEGAMRAAKRIEAFMQTARKQLDSEGHSNIFSLEHEIQDAIEILFHRSRDAGVTIRFNPTSNTLVYGNSVRFFQVAVNLISNAIDSHSGSQSDSERHVLVAIEQRPDGTCFKVTDNGCGIAPDVLPRIFDPFFTTKSKHSGIGLGLSTTRDIIEKGFGGTLTVESALGTGATFSATIPNDRKAPDRRRKSRT